MTTQPKFEPPPDRNSNFLENVPKTKVAIWWYQWFQAVVAKLTSLSGGINVTITTAKLTAGGTNGQMVFQNGILVSQTQST